MLGIYCCRKATLKTYLWSNGQRGRVQPQRFEFVSWEGRMYVNFP